MTSYTKLPLYLSFAAYIMTWYTLQSISWHSISWHQVLYKYTTSYMIYLMIWYIMISYYICILHRIRYNKWYGISWNHVLYMCNPALEESGINVQDDRDWNFFWAHTCLGNLVRNRAIRMPSEDAISICVLVLLECKVLAALKTFVRH